MVIYNGNELLKFLVCSLLQHFVGYGLLHCIGIGSDQKNKKLNTTFAE